MTKPMEDLRRTLAALLSGYDAYATRERLEVDDRLVRAKAASLLSETAERLGALEADVRRRHIPPPTREHPLPPPEALARVRQLHQIAERARSLAALIRAAPLPHRDRTWEALRSGTVQLSLLLELDLELLATCEEVRRRVHTGADLSAPRLDEVERLLGNVEGCFVRRLKALDIQNPSDLP